MQVKLFYKFLQPCLTKAKMTNDSGIHSSFILTIFFAGKTWTCEIFELIDLEQVSRNHSLWKGLLILSLFPCTRLQVEHLLSIPDTTCSSLPTLSDMVRSVHCSCILTGSLYVACQFHSSVMVFINKSGWFCLPKNVYLIQHSRKTIQYRKLILV